jgi:hypothetical protein
LCKSNIDHLDLSPDVHALKLLKQKLACIGHFDTAYSITGLAISAHTLVTNESAAIAHPDNKLVTGYHQAFK